MIDVKNLSIQFSGNFLFKNSNFKINKGDRIALVGSNGTGKTTLLKLIFGIETPEEGSIYKQKNIRIGYLPQEYIPAQASTLFHHIKLSIPEINHIESEESRINDTLSSAHINSEEKTKLLLQQGELNELKIKNNYYELNSRIEKVLIGLGFSENEFRKKVSEFSGGWRMRIELAKILLSNNDLLLLDEPTNHLDLDSLEWIIEYLQEYQGAIMVVSHDRHFVNCITDKTLEIFNKKISFYKKNYDEYLQYKILRDEQLKSQLINQQKKIKDTKKFIERFRYKATKARQVQSRIKMLSKEEEIEIPEEESRIRIKIPEPERSGSIPLEINNLTKSFNGKIVFKDLNLQFERGDKIALVGPNGSGKTTFAKIIAGKLKPDLNSSSIKIGYNTRIAYFAQEVSEGLNGNYDLLETLASFSTEYTPEQLRRILGAFLFSGNDILKKVKVLSGGEKSRLALASLLITKSNFLILDEPTNHLDYYSKQILQESLISYKGTIIIVSHDIDFLNPIVNKVLDLRNKGAEIFYGGIEYYLEKRKHPQYQFEEKNENKSDEKYNRKIEKRDQAFTRQKKYRVLNPLKKQIETCETKIESLEQNRKEIEQKLSTVEIYKDGELTRELNIRYQKLREELETEYKKWTELHEELEKLEKEF